jgi:hypothetical protein
MFCPRDCRPPGPPGFKVSGYRAGGRCSMFLRREISGGAQLDSTTKAGWNETLTRPRPGGTTLSHRMGEGRGEGAVEVLVVIRSCALSGGAHAERATKGGSAKTFTRLRGRSHFGAAKARPRPGAPSPTRCDGAPARRVGCGAGGEVRLGNENGAIELLVQDGIIGEVMESARHGDGRGIRGPVEQVAGSQQEVPLPVNTAEDDIDSSTGEV